MKRAAFRLEPVLRVRRQEERAAAVTAARAAAQARAAEAYADACDRSLDGTELPIAMSADTFVTAMIRTRALAADASAAHAQARADEEQAEMARAQWTAAAQRTSGLERLRERHLAALDAADLAAETRLVDDLVTRQHAVRIHREEAR